MDVGDEPERPLAGGNVGTGIVRVGDTVRRPLPRRAPAVHALLDHLAARGFDAAPRVLGIDGKGREILSWIDGECDSTETLWTDEAALVACARLLRDLHEATRDFPANEHDWLVADPDPARREVVCHHDFAPYNLVFRDGMPVGVIDFDLAGPGPALRDVAYAAYWMVPLGFGPGDARMRERSETDLAAGCPRLHAFCDAYGREADAALLAAVAARLRHMSDRDAMVRTVGARVTARLEREGHLAHWDDERRAFERRMAALDVAMTRTAPVAGTRP